VTARLGFVLDLPAGVLPTSALLQIGQRSMKRLWRQKVGTHFSLGALGVPGGACAVARGVALRVRAIRDRTLNRCQFDVSTPMATSHS